ncbi:MAG: 1,4-dihydroxy-2-naphthoate polyprenyltransferase [Tepidanaerobacteraceae bacterium]|nr:1,4-dihydroxy-2-naphthoate polyprenyltransferase [Tepidanaerobacteraceae bacterium]
MTIKSFFEFVEIRTKVASLIPLLLGAVFSIYRYQSFSWKNFSLMLMSLLSIDMATTAINNYIDCKKTRNLSDDCLEHNENTAKAIISFLLLLAVLFGLLLFLNTDLVVLIIGVISFAVGILYTYGPIPISRMPLGEIFSGFFMGFVIVFLAVHVNAPDQNLVQILLNNAVLSINLKLVEVIYIFLFSIPAVGGIANIMLANNICDMENDEKNKRYTLPVYIGKNKALKLFEFIYYAIYLDLLIAIVLKIIPLNSILVFFTVYPVFRNVKKFVSNPDKELTFGISVKNFALINFMYILSIYTRIYTRIASIK